MRAPELQGREWLNTGGRDLTLAGLRGKIVLLDFWTFCCINCLHVLDELRPLEAKYADVLVVIGVHSPKFEHEADAERWPRRWSDTTSQHPVLDDPELQTWKQYAVRAWPTLVVIDPEGYVVAQLSGEGHGHALEALIDDLVPSTTRRARCTAATGRTSRRRRPRPSCASPPRRSPCPAATCSSPTPGTTRWSSWRPTARR